MLEMFLIIIHGSFSSECNMANHNQPQIVPIVAKPIVFKKPRSVIIDLTRLNPLAKKQIPNCTSYESKLNFLSTVKSWGSEAPTLTILFTQKILQD